MPTVTAAMDAWFQAHDAYHKASTIYNQRLALVQTERARGNWTMSVNEEYQTLEKAQSAALQMDDTLYKTLARVESVEAKKTLA